MPTNSVKIHEVKLSTNFSKDACRILISVRCLRQALTFTQTFAYHICQKTMIFEFSQRCEIRRAPKIFFGNVISMIKSRCKFFCLVITQKTNFLEQFEVWNFFRKFDFFQKFWIWKILKKKIVKRRSEISPVR